MNTVKIIHKDPDFLVINKPPGLPVHGGDRVRGETLVDFLVARYPEIKTAGDDPILRPGIVHRLDKDTSGVMVVARNQKTFEALKDIFKNRLAEKIYWAVVCGLPEKREGIINYPIGRLIRNPLKRGVNIYRGSTPVDTGIEPLQIRIRGEREALTKYKVLRSGENYSLLEVVPKTGRMHQIRVHLAAINHPVACDKIYGGKNVCCPPGTSRQLLHARSISFSYPEGRKLHFEADPPEDFSQALMIL
ncbi:MAG: RluA family pseudouridine synthase [Candidatus Sungbacteria bacterium]|nr:RluA family pseudouridine synthase [Candidatus Sungbacteria bacterium]